MTKSKVSKVDEDLNKALGYETSNLGKIDEARWTVMSEKGDPRTRDLWDHTPIAYANRKQRCNSQQNSRAYWAFRCDKATHEENVVRDYLLRHDLPIPQDFNNPVELQSTGVVISPQNIPDIPATPESQKPNLRNMWATEHDIKITVPIYHNNIFILTDREQFEQIVSKATKGGETC